MKNFEGKLAVVTGGGTGMGRELCKQLASAGCHVALCDVDAETMAETRTASLECAPVGTRVTAHLCDVADEQAVLAFRDAVAKEHSTQHINLLFNNAGIGGGGSFIKDERSEWDRVFGVCWFGVYYMSRAFVPMLIASDEAHLINTSSVNGFWATMGPHSPHSAYSSAKFAVKGFTEALVNDFRIHAPHVKVSIVMPGHIGTSIMQNSLKAMGVAGPEQLTPEQLAPMRETVRRMGMPVDTMSDDMLRAGMKQRQDEFRDNAPTTAAEAATVMLDAVRDERWRVPVGEDAKAIDELVRETPEDAYEMSFYARLGAKLGTSGGPAG